MQKCHLYRSRQFLPRLQNAQPTEIRQIVTVRQMAHGFQTDKVCRCLRGKDHHDVEHRIAAEIKSELNIRPVQPGLAGKTVEGIVDPNSVDDPSKYAGGKEVDDSSLNSIIKDGL